MSKSTNTEWGISEVERATGKSSACDGFGHFRVIYCPKLGFHGLPEVQ